MSGKTTGQLACEAFWAAVRRLNGGEDAGDWPGNAWEWAHERNSHDAWHEAARAASTPLREQLAGLATEMHAMADLSARLSSIPQDGPGEASLAQALHEYAARIRLALGPEAS